MNEAEARRVLLVAAFETPMTAPWTAADAEWASREAARREGEQASGERFVVRRAELAWARLEERGVTLPSSSGTRQWLIAAGLVIAFVLGTASGSIGPDGRISILAPPLLGLTVWNVVVYALLVLARVMPRGVDNATGRLRAMASSVMHRWSAPQLDRSLRVRHAADWVLAARPLHASRAAAWLHTAAALFAVGALAALYIRGLAFEYRAGWDSTFLTPTSVRQVIGIVLGPASALTGIALPDVSGIAALRFATSTGENAARWIHLYATTIAGLVVLPRLVLAAVAARQAHRHANSFELPLTTPYFERLLRAQGGRALDIAVVPYSHRVPPEAMPRLRTTIERATGQAVTLTLAEPVPQGDEDRALAAAGNAAIVIALMQLAATPERETHGLLLQTLHPRLLVIDEQGFASRYGTQRTAERRTAWQRMLQDIAQPAVFIDLASGAGDDDTLAAALAPLHR